MIRRTAPAHPAVRRIPERAGNADLVLKRIERALSAWTAESDLAVYLDDLQMGEWGVGQGRLIFFGDGATYRLIVAPMNSPISVGPDPADTHFEHEMREASHD